MWDPNTEHVFVAHDIMWLKQVFHQADILDVLELEGALVGHQRILGCSVPMQAGRHCHIERPDIVT